VTLAEVGNGVEVWPVQPGHRHDIDPSLVSLGELTRGVQAAAVAIH
jgi:hypothetical protein